MVLVLGSSIGNAFTCALLTCLHACLGRTHTYTLTYTHTVIIMNECHSWLHLYVGILAQRQESQACELAAAEACLLYLDMAGSRCVLLV